MEQNIQMKRCEVDLEQQILDLEIEGILPYPIQGDRIRISVVFCAGSLDRYFPMIADGTVCEDSYTQFHAATRIQLDSVFFEYHPEHPDDIILKFCSCTPDYEWTVFDTDVVLDGALFLSKMASGTGLGNLLSKGLRFLKYLICTVLLPIWLLSGYLALKGRGTLHPAAKGRQGKQAMFYHAHGLVMDWTGYGYSIREFKTNYFRRQYEKACRKYPQTDGILFLSEREVETGGNLDLIRKALKERERQESADSLGEQREFLVNRPVSKLSWKELRRLAVLLAVSRVVILEDFYPHLHALTMRSETKILQLWHACGAFKLFGLSNLGISDHLQQDTRNHRSYDAALTSGEGIVPFYSEAFGVPSSHIYPIGVPRTDFFFQDELVEQKVQEIYQRYPILQGKRVVLFAPTFRGSGNLTAYYPTERFPVHQIMEKLPDDVVLMIKNHPFVHNQLDIAPEYQNRVLDLTGAENINDLLLVTDVLITDYSSVIFEAAILQIPMLFYVFDLEDYIRSRDLYFEFADFVPGKIIRELPELIQEILQSLSQPSGSNNGSDDASDSFRKFFLGAIDGQSTERVIQLIEQLYDGATNMIH